MRFLIITTDYPEFLRSLYADHPSLSTQSYDAQMQARVDTLFGTADFQSHALRKLGHEAWEIIPNNESLQRRWAAEHGLSLPSPSKSWQLVWRREVIPWLRYRPDPRWMYEILAAQIRHYRPDVLLVQDVTLRASFFAEMKPQFRLLVGQSAAPLPGHVNWKTYDLMVSSLPNYIDYFRHHGVRAEFNRLAFDPRVLSHLKTGSTPVDVSFVGTVSRSHSARMQWLEELCAAREVHTWGHGFDRLPSSSPLLRYFHGPAWGRDMYQHLHDSRITLNYHIGIAGDYANNLRLYEATGAGTLLLTDWKKNLSEIFEPAREVAAYHSTAECREFIEHYLAHEPGRAAIAAAGQSRTLREHTYLHRMQELVAIVEKSL